MTLKAMPDDFTMDPEIQQILPTHDIQALQEDIKKNGQIEPIVVGVYDGKRTVVNGHHRLKILKSLDREILFVEREFQDKEAAKTAALEQQLLRRNLGNEAKTYAIGKLYRQEKLTHGGARGQGDLLKTDEHIGQQYDVSPKTVKRAGIWSEAVDLIHQHFDLETRDNILTGDLRLTQSQAGKLVKLDSTVLEEHEELEDLLKSLTTKTMVRPVIRARNQFLKLIPEDMEELLGLLANLWEGEITIKEFSLHYKSPSSHAIRQWRLRDTNDFNSCFRTIPLDPSPRFYLKMELFEKWCVENSKEFERQGVSTKITNCASLDPQE